MGMSRTRYEKINQIMSESNLDSVEAEEYLELMDDDYEGEEPDEDDRCGLGDCFGDAL